MATGGESSYDIASDMVGRRVMRRSCEPCIKRSKSKHASVFCKVCTEFLCEECRDIHQRDTSRKHNIVNVQSIDFANSLDMKGMEKCRKHFKDIEFFCEDHAELCCISCVTIHRKCDKFNELSHLSGEEDTELRDLKSAMLKANSDILTLSNGFSQAEREVNDVVKDMKERIIQLFEEAKSKLLEEADSLISKKMTVYNKRREFLADFETKIANMLPVYSEVLENGSPQQLFIVARTVDGILKEFENHSKDHDNSSFSINMNLHFKCEISNLAENVVDVLKLNAEQTIPEKEMHLLGSEGAVESVETETVDNGSSTASATSPQLTLELLLSIDLQTTGDEDQDPFLTGLDFLPDGNLVAIDNRNIKCIIMDDRLQRLGTPYKFNSKPDDVACVSQYELAVTMSNKTICFLTVSPKFTISLTRQINASSYVDSIWMMNKSTMLVSCYHDLRPARMISIDGTESDFEKVVYQPKTYNIGENKCTFVASKNTLVMTDRFAHTVFFFDIGKGGARIVTNKSIQEPRGGCVGPRDTVLVSSMGTHSIVQLNVNGELLCVYPVDIKNPFNLCTSTDGTRLAITNGGVRLKQLCLYKIQTNAPQA